MGMHFAQHQNNTVSIIEVVFRRNVAPIQVSKSECLHVIGGLWPYGWRCGLRLKARAAVCGSGAFHYSA
jgi:hypothetical protein